MKSLLVRRKHVDLDHALTAMCDDRYRDDVAQGVAPSRWAHEGIAKQGRQAAPEKTQVYVPGLVLRADDLRMGNWLCRDDGGRDARPARLRPATGLLPTFHAKRRSGCRTERASP